MSKPFIKRKIYVIGMLQHYMNWCQAEFTNDIKSATAILFTGGPDIEPALYGKQPHPETSTFPSRDKHEITMFEMVRDMGKPIIGVCRGAQLVCSQAGGILVQHQANPKSHHYIDTFDGKKVCVSSSHHQAQYPWGLPVDQYRLLGWSTGISAFHDGEAEGDEMVVGKVPGNCEVEEVYYRGIHALAIQSHPENVWHHRFKYAEARASIEHHQSLLTRFLNGEL